MSKPVGYTTTLTDEEFNQLLKGKLTEIERDGEVVMVGNFTTGTPIHISRPQLLSGTPIHEYITVERISTDEHGSGGIVRRATEAEARTAEADHDLRTYCIEFTLLMSLKSYVAKDDLYLERKDFRYYGANASGGCYIIPKTSCVRSPHAYLTTSARNTGCTE